MESSKTMERRLVSPGRVLEGMGRVDVEEPTSVGAQLLDGLHEADRPHGNGLADPVEDVVDVDRAIQGVDGALAHEDQAGDDGDGKEDVEHATDHIDPEVADGR